MTQLSDQRVLVTGGAGFIGSHLVDALRADNDVRVLDNLSTGDPSIVPDDVTLIEGDICDETTVREATAGVDVVFHEAAKASVTQSVEDPIGTEAVNVDGTLEVLEAAREEDARVVLASSTAIYGDPERIPVEEDDAKTPNSPYGIHKLSIDHYARTYHDLYGLKTVALRYFNVYGPGQQGGDYSGVINVFRRQATNDEPLTVEGDGTQTRDFIHVDDVVQANLAAATTDYVGAGFNVGSGEETSILELAEAVREAANADVPIEHVDPREGDIQRSCADISRAREVLGFEPTVDLETGLRDLLLA